ncbi:MAG: peptidoglycan DD-metalloendopeptidase family protein [Anaerolineae bacterium]
MTRAVAILAARLWRWNSDRSGQRPVLGRWSAHIAIFLSVALLWALSGLHVPLSESVFSEAGSPSAGARPQTVGQRDASSTSWFLSRFSYQVSAQSQIVRQSKPYTVIPERPRLEVITYAVQVGDTTESIAEQFGLQPTTIMWSNPAIEKAPDLLKVGQQLVILPLDGVYHTVEAGDTLADLAKAYKVSVQDIVECPFNDIPSGGELHEGEKIIVPGGTKPYERREVTAYTGEVPDDAVGSGHFRWPAPGYISQGYWYGHRALDIANAEGTAVVASDGGYVSFAGWTDVGYGYLVVIDHANGYQTYYAHLDKFYVAEGEPVEAGQIIATMGNTGNSTGPHLHFEIRYNGALINPLAQPLR